MRNSNIFLDILHSFLRLMDFNNLYMIYYFICRLCCFPHSDFLHLTKSIAKPVAFALDILFEILFANSRINIPKLFDSVLLLGEHKTNENIAHTSFLRISILSKHSNLTVFIAGFSYAFAGERTFSSTWRGKQRNTREPEAVERDEHLWMREVTWRWIRGRIDDTTSTADTARAMASTSVGPRKSTARLVSPSFSWPFHYRSTSCTRSTAISSLSYSTSLSKNPRIFDPKIQCK